MLEVIVPFTDADRLKNFTWEFYLHAINRDFAQDYSHKIVIRKEPLCISKIGPINIDPEVNRNDSSKIKTRLYSITHWAEDYDSSTPYIKWPVNSLYKQWGGDAGSFSLGSGDCPLMYPFYYMESKALFESPESQSRNYTINNNLKFISNTTDPSSSYFAMFTQNLGYQYTFNFTTIDVRGFGVSQRLQFTLCGPDFNVQSFCFREQNLTEEEEA